MLYSKNWKLSGNDIKKNKKRVIENNSKLN